jgi:hypothetical protein
MEQNEQGKRKGAAKEFEKEFEKSLDHLQHLLEENQTEEQLAPDLVVDSAQREEIVEESPIFDLAQWEDAVADIEQYFESKDKQG